MTASQIVFAKGSKLYREDPDTSVFASIPQMRVIPSPSATQQYLDGTNHDSEGGFEENVPGVKSGDDLAFTLVYSPNIPLHKQLYQDFIDQTKLNWRSVLPDGINGWEFEARVAKFDLPLNFNEVALLNGGLKMTGLPVAIELGS